MENVAKLKDIDEIYHYNVITPSNIQLEMEMLYRYAKQCKHITEFGFGRGKSASAFIAARPKKVISYDIKDQWGISQKWTELAAQIGVEFVYIQESSIEVDIEPTDMLFIDSYHTYEHKKKELSLQSKVKKFIILHDTFICAHRGEDGSEPGFLRAVGEFLRQYPEWRIIEQQAVFNQNGYIVMGRIS